MSRNHLYWKKIKWKGGPRREEELFQRLSHCLSEILGAGRERGAWHSDVARLLLAFVREVRMALSSESLPCFYQTTLCPHLPVPLPVLVTAHLC